MLLLLLTLNTLTFGHDVSDAALNCQGKTNDSIGTCGQQVQCLASIALDRCSSDFIYCKDGKLIPAQCPQPSLFDSNLLLCVYNLPECQAVPPTTEHPSEATMGPEFYTAESISPTSERQLSTIHNMLIDVKPEFYTRSDITKLTDQPNSSHSDTHPQNYHIFSSPKNNSFPLSDPRHKPSDAYEGSRKFLIDVIISTQGSAERVHSRVRRNSDNKKAKDFSSCNSSNSPGYVATGFCSRDFVFCRSVGNGVTAACPVGDAFDSISKKCVTLSSCVQTGSTQNLKQQIPQPTITSLVEGTTSPLEVEQGCVENSDYALGCTDNFIKCVNGHFYPMKCPEGLVFDRLYHKCNYRRSVAACRAESILTRRHVEGLTDREFPTQSVNIVSADAVTNSPDPLTAHFQAVARCSSKFLIYASGAHSEVHCTSPLVFNPVTMTCDRRGVVSECKDSVEPRVTQSDEVLSCVYDEKRPQLALTFCGRAFGVCSKQGVFEHKECSIGFLFDSHLNSCVPADQCGLERLRDLLTKIARASSDFGTRKGEHLENTTLNATQGCTEDSDFALDCFGNFMKCVNGRFYPMKCPEGFVFDRLKHMCNHPHDVAACRAESISFKRHMEGLTERVSIVDPIVPAARKGVNNYSESPIPETGIESSTQSVNLGSADPSTISEDPCPAHAQAVARCSSKFAICANGVRSEVHCTSPLVFNPVTMTCDAREVVSECQNLVAEATTQSNVAVSCVYDQEHPQFALGFCGRAYGICSEQGLLEHKECSVGFLFDSHLNSCVPAGQCGLERLRDLLTKMIPAALNFETEEGEHLENTTLNATQGCTEDSDFALDCFGKFMKCVNGRFYPMKCPEGFVFDRLKHMCNHPHDVAACRAESISFKRHMEGLTERVSIVDPIVPAARKGAVSCVYDPEHPEIALSFCGRAYGVCSEQGLLENEECSVGFLFDSHLNSCVPAGQCGLEKMIPAALNFGTQEGEHLENTTLNVTQRCTEDSDFALDCTGNFMKCVNGHLYPIKCPEVDDLPN
ncbi:hypothetical protein KIN20_006879 [Parelaphostrongylus tenuis]|uniref:Chitin-binding type-2 domain-containing protein n=1 Tax=Parelaphostrongylus tenuis TaxID=148309 RepID=A0AAD5QJL1_PARTN|nr:hypothetical protein KIN20_006879 [Parelaphostrongylus tenuis]